MYGAILGDIIGSPFEFDRGDKTKDFKLFSRRSHFTDDSVMTLAVCEALLKVGQDATVKEIEDAVITSMQSWGRRYPNEGYGGYFRCWLTARHPEPYNSFGNGSAMRVSAAGWLYDSLEKTRVVAKATANVTHNHPEGIKGAEATASAIFMARNGSSKEEIKKYIENEFHYDLNRTLDEIRPSFHMDETCQKTVPEAIIAFLEARDFEDAIRNAVSLGGDTDTLGAITGSIAEAYFGISETLISECRNRINKDMRDIVDAFYSLVRKDDSPNTNQMIEKAINQYYVHNDKEGMILFMNMMINAMNQGGEFIVPYITKNPFLSKEQINSINIGDTFTLDHDVKLKMETVKDASGIEWLGVFTSTEEMHKGSSGNVQINQSILSILRLALDLEEKNGIVINPFGKYMQISKAMILLLIGIYEEHEK
ncbi:aDP-ribosylglycohydrolase [Catenibacterium sp. CAG:290]|uniref:ADP-ribosylglycohydrolase family protein n=1 Tax=Catenibacterium sp. CAG:290 TaxID=1262767 RepID=UPI000337538D|nr:ADP-ribosylglycohydrolase family protein [Catenibacterium sp. CAG:290]CDE28532.1 aDP-ribosylglycohydrolase [Catenibacterium sp. CAG:290]